MGRALLAVSLALLCVLAGCAAPVAESGRADPAVDRLGWERGYWYDDPLPVTDEDGLNESERRAVVARTMARVERVRGLEFEESVSVEVISRDAYRSRYRGGGNRSASYAAWNNQIWEALFLVGEDANVATTFDSTLGATVQGFYSGGDIVVVSDAATPSIDRRTLAHELVHALQDQHFGLGANPPIRDERLAEDGVIEGDANYVERLYERRCAENWSCLPLPERTTGGTTDGFNMGVFLSVYTPYATGESFVATVRQREGWAGVDDLYENYPASTEQVIHPDAYPDERPVEVTLRDRSSDRWSRFDLGRPSHDTLGEASVYAMLWAQGVVERGGRSPYRYDHPLSTGWGGDRIVPYRNGDGGYGYVWKTVWDTPADAREFADAYRSILADRSVGSPVEGVYVLPPSDPFGDAFRVERSGRTVRIVNGPRPAALDGIDGP